MIRSATTLLAALLLPAAFAQQPGTPAAIPTIPMPTLRTGTRLVLVDVIVTDDKGRPVHGLKASDFTLLEDRSSQQLKAFEEHSAPTAGQSTGQLAKTAPMPHLPPDVYTNYTPVPVGGSALTILLIDKVDTPLRFQSILRQKLMDYLAKVKPGTRIAIFALTNHLYQIQGFTDDPALLRAAAEKKAQAAFSPVNPFQPDQVTLNSNAGLQQLARYLAGIPGRKNLVWFAGSFPLNPFAPQDNVDPTVIVPDTRQQYAEISDLLTQNQVAVYPVDITGLQPPPSTSAAMGGRPSPGASTAMNIGSYIARSDEHAIMREIADSTGGRALYDDNGFMDAVDKAVSDGSNYYTLAYTPANPHWDGSFRHIQVVLRQPLHYQLHYRSGYYAVDSPAHPSTAFHQAGQATKGSTLYNAMMPGSPQPTQIVFTAKVTPAGPGTEDTLAPGNEGSPGLHPPFRRYSLNFVTAPQGMRFTSANGVHHGQVEFVAFVFDPTGQLINATGSAIDINVTGDRWTQLVHDGMSYHEELSLPAKGQYFIRVAVHDLGSDHIGAIEVPVYPDAPAVTAK